MSVAVLSKLSDGTGNKTTAERIRCHLRSEFVTHLCDITNFQSSKQFAEFGKKHDVKAVIGIHLIHSGSLLADSDIPFAVIFGGTDLNIVTDDASKIQLMEKVVNHARYLVAFTSEMKKSAVNMWNGIDSESILIQPQGVQTNPADYTFDNLCLDFGKGSFLNSNKKNIFLLVGGIRPVKDVTYLFNIFTSWHQMDPSICLVIIGPELDAKYAKQCKDLLERTEGVYIFPEIAIEKTHSLIQQSVALVNSSHSEGMAGAILEALHIGTPVIARCNSGNCSVITDMNNGLLYETPSDFKEKAKVLLSTPHLRHTLVSNGKNYIQQCHDIKMEYSTYINLVNKMLCSNVSV